MRRNVETIDIMTGDLPQPLLDEIESALRHFFVSLAIGGEQRDNPAIAPIGSGTLVRVEQSYFILTAAHVWEQIKKAGQVFLALVQQPSAYCISADLLSPRLIYDQSAPEYGPDLALLELPAKDVANIGAQKSFLNLSLQKASLVDDGMQTSNPLIAVFGNVAQRSTVEVEGRIVTTHMRALALYTVKESQCERGGYDYIDVGADLNLEDAVTDFGGVSGAGLWVLGISRSKATGKYSWDGNRRLRGVAFWQSGPQEGRRSVRCHGPNSIYNVAWYAWRLDECGR